MLADTSEWVGTTLCDGRYRVLRKLGEGGMAHVYVAHDDKLERDVVIKVPRANLIHDATFAGRFTREVRSLAKLAHPHVVPLIDIGQHEGVPFAVMHYLTGGSLRERQPRGADGQTGPMPVESVHAWLPQIAQALDFVHKSKYIHRDVKPENILFDDDGQVFLSDLGIVKALTENQDPSKKTVFTGAGMVLGTPHYMAPELILGETVDGRVDQYALAITLYEALTGQFPFNGSSAPAIFIQQTTKPPPSLREVLPSIPVALSAAVDKALSKSARERFATCGEFVQSAIGRLSGAHPVATHTVAPTVLEQRAFKEPVVATLSEPNARTDTPSDLRNPTALATKPNWQNSAPRPAAGASSRSWLVAVLVVAALAIGASAFFFLRDEPGELKLAKVEPLSLVPGEKQQLRVTIERQRLDGDVSCSFEGLPDGVKAEPVVVPAGKSEATLDLAAADDAPTKKVTATLKAKCQNIETSVPVEVAILSAPLASLRLSPIAPRTLKAGEIVTVLLHVERRNCKGPVVLSVDGLPSGVTWHGRSFNVPVIPADQTTYPLALKAAADSPGVDQAKVIVTGVLEQYPPAVGTLLLTVIAAPPIVTPKPPDPVVKKTETVPDPIVKNDPKPEPVKVKPEPKPIPVVPAELILANMLNVTLTPGERQTVWVQIERKNCEGPVAISVAGLPPGVRIDPAPLGPIPATRLALGFDLVADPSAVVSKDLLTVTTTLGKASASTKFNVIVLKKPAPVIPPVAKEALWNKTDTLTDKDPLDTVRKNSWAKSYPVPLIAGKTYTIEMTSEKFDSYLRIEKVAGVSLKEDDDSGGGLNARIVFTPESGGRYYLIATSYKPGAVGEFTLTIR
jgi:serine/threonine protein kinase